MDLRPGYKQTEIGPIPEDWEVAELRKFVREHNSGIYKKSSLYGIGHNIIGVSDIYGIEFIDGQAFASVPLSTAEIEKHTLREGDLLYGESSLVREGIARTVCVTGKGAGTAFAWHTRRYSVDQEKLHPAFLSYFVESWPARKHMIDQSIQTAITGINTAAYFSCPIARPPIREQIDIARAIFDANSAVEAVSSLIAKKRNMRTGAMQCLLTGEIRLPGFTAPWQKKRLGNHVSFLKNGVHSRAQLTVNDPVRYLHYGDIHVAQTLRLDLQVTELPRLPSAEATRLSRLETGDVVFVDASEDLSGVGKSLEIMNAESFDAVAGQHTIAARFDKDVLADGFKGYLQHIPAFTTHLRRLAAGTKVYATNRKHIASAEILLPKPDEQRAIVRVLSDMDAEITALEARLDKTRALKQAMMQALLTGRVRLPVQGEALDAVEVAHA